MNNTLVLLSLLWTQIAFGGGAVISFGGSDINQQIHSVAQDLAEQIEAVPQFLLPEKNLSNRIRGVMMKLKITVSEQPLYWEGSEVLAVNFPNEEPKRLSISKSVWKQTIWKSRFEIDSIILHEILPLIGVIDRDYVVSNDIMDVLHTWNGDSSTEYFIRRYVSDRKFLQIWAANSKEYYKTWGPDGKQLIAYLAYRHFPMDENDLRYWLQIISGYVGQYSTNVCYQLSMPLMLKSIRDRGPNIYHEIGRYLDIWYSSFCPSTRMHDI
jgi:hypothetical protein